MQSMLNPAGVDAQHIATLWWVMFGICTAVFLIVIAFLARALMVRADVTAELEAKKTKFVAGGAVISLVILVGILFASVAVGRSTTMGVDDPLTIEVIGHQWWWEVTYLDESPHLYVTGANEIHMPAGQRVRFRLRSNDVIHSLWVPNLGGKFDLFPDRENTLWLEATEPGVYRGQCAEFCGMQHAHMAFMVVVHEQAEFEAWLERERAPAAEPADELALRGREVLETSTCATCHRVRGTRALGSFGPDLTHVGSRRTIAAGSMPNTRARLTAWIVDPQQFKPGAHMPPTNLDAQSLHALVYYLENLQ